MSETQSNPKYDINFSFPLRQATQVAYAVSTEIHQNTRFGFSIGDSGKGQSLPYLLSIRGREDALIFRFEGGTVVQVNMYVGDDADHRQSCVVTHVLVRYYPLDPVTYHRSGEKISEVWGARKLLELKEHRYWWHPNVHIRRCHIGIYIRDGKGWLEENAPYLRDEENDYRVSGVVYEVDEGSEGLERAKAEAQVLLEKLLADEVD